MPEGTRIKSRWNTQRVQLMCLVVLTQASTAVSDATSTIPRPARGHGRPGSTVGDRQRRRGFRRWERGSALAQTGTRCQHFGGSPVPPPVRNLGHGPAGVAARGEDVRGIDHGDSDGEGGRAVRAHRRGAVRPTPGPG